MFGMILVSSENFQIIGMIQQRLYSGGHLSQFRF